MTTLPRLTALQLLPLPFSDLQQSLETHFEVIRLWESADKANTLKTVAGRVHILLTSAMTPTRAELIDQLPALKAICSMGVGFDAIDVEYAQSKGIPVSNTPDVLNDCVADLAFSLVLSCARQVVRGDQLVRSGQWGQAPALPLGRSVHHKKMGIVGLGRIGHAIAQRAAGFSMTIGYHNRTERTESPYTYFPSLKALAEWSDFLVIATVGGAQTRHLVNREVLQALGPKGIIVNIARGSVIDEQALIDCLHNGEVGGAGLDVFEHEPHVPDALKQLPNVVLLPHIGSATTETRRAMASLVLENAFSFLQHGHLTTPIPTES